MSETTETGTQAEDNAALIQPATDDAPNPGQEQTPTDDAPKPEDDKPKLDPRDRAIRQEAFQRREAERRAAALEAELRRLRPTDPNAPPSQADIDRIVEQRAAELLQRREQQANTEKWVAAGEADYPDFTERCNTLADMGAGQNPAFMAAVSRLPQGHKLVAELGANPAQAHRILALQPVDMAIELAALQHKIISRPAPNPKAISKAPEPIRPIGSRASAEPNPETMSSEDFQKWWNKRTRG